MDLLGRKVLNYVPQSSISEKERFITEVNYCVILSLDEISLIEQHLRSDHSN
jgi:hypothetical protein